MRKSIFMFISGMTSTMALVSLLQEDWWLGGFLAFICVASYYAYKTVPGE